MMNWIAVAMGGAIGACCRYAIALSMSGSTARFPFATFTANTVGCFLMGLGYVLLVEKVLLPEPWRQFLLVGALGALTTYSTFSVEVVGLIYGQSYRIAAYYIFLTTFVCIASVLFGMFVARTILN